MRGEKREKIRRCNRELFANLDVSRKRRERKGRQETTKNWMSQVLGFSEKLNRRKSIREVLKKRARVREREKSINRMLT